MKEKIQLPNDNESKTFQDAFDIVFNNVYAMNNGAVIMKLLAEQGKKFGDFFQTFIGKIENTYGKEKSASFVASLNTVKEYAQTYDEVRAYLNNASDIISKSKSELSILRSAKN